VVEEMKNINSGVFKILIEFATILELSAAELPFSQPFGGWAGGKSAGKQKWPITH
jgi:hypothetical protein